MRFELSHRQQQLIYLAITLVMLALAVFMVRWQAHGQNQLAELIEHHRQILGESGLIKQELVQIHTHLRLDAQSGIQRIGDDQDPALNIFGTPFNLSVSRYTLQTRFERLKRLLENASLPEQIVRKFKSQIEEFSASVSTPRADQPDEYTSILLQMQGIMLSIDQLEALQNLEYRKLTEVLDARIQRDNRVFIGFLVTLVLLSYLLVRWISNRIRDDQDRFTAELEDKNAELERFVYTVSHDLRSPLVSIKGFVGLMHKDIAAGNLQKVCTDADRIDRAAGDMGDLLEGLLELSRIGRIINPSVAGSLTELVTRAAEPLQDRIAQGGITLVIGKRMPDYWGDEIRLIEVFQNLLENAIKFLGNQPEPRIEVNAWHAEDKLISVVRDNGIGIEPSYHERIFNLFERLDTNTEGSGIGMSLVKRIIDAHGGTIEVESIGAGKGTAFVITLPRNPADLH